MRGEIKMIIAVTNQKGGVGKTTTVLNLGAAAALDQKRVCLIDLDPQANLTKTFIRPREGQPTVGELLTQKLSLPEVLVTGNRDRLSLLPERIDLSGLERTAGADPRLPYRLREALQPFAQEFDLVLIDTPPTLGALTINAMTAATHLLIPIQSSYYCLHGTNDLMETYRLVQADLNPDLNLLGVLITMYDPRTTLAREVVEEIRRVFGGQVLCTVVRRCVKLEESPVSAQSVITYAPKSVAAQEYCAAYQELMGRCGG